MRGLREPAFLPECCWGNAFDLLLLEQVIGNSGERVLDLGAPHFPVSRLHGRKIDTFEKHRPGSNAAFVGTSKCDLRLRAE
jgi:hypothetical protein